MALINFHAVLHGIIIYEIKRGNICRQSSSTVPNTGPQKSMPKKLAEMTNSDICSYDNIKSLSGHDLIVHMGGLYAGGVKGAKANVEGVSQRRNAVYCHCGTGGCS